MLPIYRKKTTLILRFFLCHSLLLSVFTVLVKIIGDFVQPLCQLIRMAYLNLHIDFCRGYFCEYICIE